MDHSDPTAPRSSTLATIALTLGIAAFLFGWLPIIGVVMGLIAVVVGIVALRKTGRGKAPLTGLVLGGTAAVFSLVISIAFGAFLGAQPAVTADPASEPTSTSAPASTPEAVPPAPSTEAEPSSVREYWPMTGEVRVPLFVGMNLEEAREAAKRLRLTLREEDERNERGIWMASNWTVVWQDIAPGSSEREGAWVEVRVLKNDEVTDEVTKTLAYDLHNEERMFTGVITGYEREGTIDVSTVLVDAAPVTLDLVQPLAPACGAPLKDGYDAARAELERELPIGQRVLVVMSERGKSDGFVHVLGDSGAEPAVARPADSVNERLVRTGWWVPDSVQMEGGIGVSGYGSETVAFLPYTPRYPAESQAVDYVGHIARAGDEAVAQYVGTVGDCRRAAEADADAYVASWQQSEREREKSIAEMERRISSNYYFCRDGDGDGICYER